MKFPKRFLPEDVRLHKAVDALDPGAIRQAVIDGARTELRDPDGNTALWALVDKAANDIPEMSEESARAFAACLDSLMECGADINARHHEARTAFAKRTCADREHDCEGCWHTGRYSGDLQPDEQCHCRGLVRVVSENIEEAIGDDEHPFTGFCDAFWEWNQRTLKDKGLRESFDEKIALERIARKPEPQEEKTKSAVAGAEPGGSTGLRI